MKVTVAHKKPTGDKHTQIRFSAEIPATRLVVRGHQTILEVKSPKTNECNNRKWVLFVRSIICELKKHRVENALIVWKNLTTCESLTGDLGQRFAEAAHMAHYEFRTYKKKPTEGWSNIREIVILTTQREKVRLVRSVRKGTVIADYVNQCRSLANMPGDDMTPKILVREAKKMIRGTTIRAKVLGEREMRRLKMNGVLTVGRGSVEESQFLILEYKGAKNTKAKPTVLVGKGVTFDTGGIDTKPHPYGLEMMMDMSGGAAVISAIAIAAKLKLKKNIVVLVPAVENMPSGHSMRPGDVIHMMDGTTVEIGHTDAEGRLILADALCYAKKYKPKCVIDVATLTGAAMIALGERATAVFSRDEQLAEKTALYSEESGDYSWRLPLWEEYEDEIKGVVGEISNIRTKGHSGYGGSITAAVFLHHFAKDYPSWMHLDIAPTMTAVYNENLAKGAKGAPVRLLVKLLEN